MYAVNNTLLTLCVIREYRLDARRPAPASSRILKKFYALFFGIPPTHSSTYLYTDEFDLLSSPRIFAIHLMIVFFFLHVHV